MKRSEFIALMLSPFLVPLGVKSVIKEEASYLTVDDLYRARDLLKANMYREYQDPEDIYRKMVADAFSRKMDEDLTNLFTGLQ